MRGQKQKKMCVENPAPAQPTLITLPGFVPWPTTDEEWPAFLAPCLESERAIPLARKLVWLYEEHQGPNPSTHE